LTDADQVVIDGADRLDEGTLVRVRKPGELDAIVAGSGRRGRGGRGGRGGADAKAGGGNAGAPSAGAPGAVAPGTGPTSTGPTIGGQGIVSNPGGFRDARGSKGGGFKGKKGGGAPQ
jgi:hypothetical protein